MKTADVTKNVLVPQHSKITKAEAKELLEHYSIELQDLPKILKSDSAIQKLNANPGDVIKIERASPTAGTAIYYRVVTNG